jgi:hypothetical protein
MAVEPLIINNEDEKQLKLSRSLNVVLRSNKNMSSTRGAIFIYILP